MRIAPMPQRHLMMETGNEMIYRTGKEMIRNGNIPTNSTQPTVEESIRIYPSGYRYEMPTPAYHMNNNAPQYSPGYVSFQQKTIKKLGVPSSLKKLLSLCLLIFHSLNEV